MRKRESEKEKKNMSGGGAGREGENRKQVLPYQCGAQCGARIHKPWDHDLSKTKSHMLNKLNHPANSLRFFFLCLFIYFWEREIEWAGEGQRERERETERERERDRESQTGSELLAQTLTQGWNPWPMRSEPEPKTRDQCLTSWATLASHHLLGSYCLLDRTWISWRGKEGLLRSGSYFPFCTFFSYSLLPAYNTWTK